LAISGKSACAGGRSIEIVWSFISQWVIRAQMARVAGVGVLAVVLFTADAARGQDVQQDPQEVQRERDRATCEQQLPPIEKAIEHDVSYAIGWRDAWLLLGATFVTLNLTSAFQNYGYRRNEGIILAVQSTLLMIQKPDATNYGRALAGLRTAESTDPCLALANARQILDAEADDFMEHNHIYQHVLAMAIPAIMTGIVAGASGHFDWASAGNEGVNMLIGMFAGELQVLTYPRPSMQGHHPPIKVGAASLSVSF
jgi:hypothetical protein